MHLYTYSIHMVVHTCICLHRYTIGDIGAPFDKRWSIIGIIGTQCNQPSGQTSVNNNRQTMYIVVQGHSLESTSIKPSTQKARAMHWTEELTRPNPRNQPASCCLESWLNSSLFLRRTG